MAACLASSPLDAASSEDVIFESPAALDSTLESEPNYAAVCNYRNRAGRPSFSSHTSSGSGSTNLTSADSDSDSGSEPSTEFDRHTESDTTSISEVQTWGSRSTDSGDNSINSVPSLPANSVAGDSDMGSRYIPNHNSLAASRLVGHDPAPGTQSHLPCPFRWDGCDVRFDIAEKKKWMYHSLDHFSGVTPPAHLICPYGDCRKRFAHDNGIQNWKNRMEHYAEHVEKMLEQLRDSRGWAEDDDIDVEALSLLEMPEKVDINFQQYMVYHGANRIGLDLVINPKPKSELDSIPRGYMNRMPIAYGGPRFREVVYFPIGPVEENLDSRSAGTMLVRDSRRTGEAAKVLTARTSGKTFRPSQPQLSRSYSAGGRRVASERVIQM